MEDTLSIVLHDAITIKNESMEEDIIGSDLDESSDDAGSIENIPIKTESSTEDPPISFNLEFPLKTEPEVNGHDSTTEGGIGDVNGLNMDDVWKILGIDNKVKINTIKESNRKLSADSGTNVSINSPDHFEMVDFIETVKRKQIHISLTNCDYMLKDRKSSDVTDSADENEKKRPVQKSKRTPPPKKLPLDHAAGIKRVFDDIIKDANKLNKQFALPFEYLTNIDMNLISTEKDHDNVPNDLDSKDLLKLPARKCYYCKGTCLNGKIISCDFCPAHFHLNCLNPPLCTIPDVKWMCPLHPHHVLERVMKNPSSVTELMSWWSKFSIPIDDEDVKSSFIKKIKSLDKKATNRKIIRSSVKIPDIVKYHYKHPPPRIPSLEELVRSKSTSIFDIDFVSTRHDPIDRPSNHISKAPDSKSNSESRIRKSVTSAQQTASTSHAESNGTKKYNLRPFKKAKWKKLLELTSDQRNTSRKSNGVKIRQTDSNSPPDSSTSTNESAFGANEIGENDAASETLQKLVVDSSVTNLCWKKVENYVIRDINRNFITGGVSITTLSEDIRRLLMIQKIKQLTEDVPPSFTPNANPYPLFHPLLKDDIKDTLLDRPRGPVRAVLCPLSHRPLIYMYGQSLSIGSGFSNDICLRNYGNCNFVSEDHAVIFYDKVTNTYELINYSEYNTVVDGVCYTCDISRNKNENPQPAQPNNSIVPKPAARTPKKKPTNAPSTTSRPVQSKRSGSTAASTETRSSYKKLIHDIDKLVSKSQQEMAAIADEDLNEISKAIKNGPTEIKTSETVQTVRKRVPSRVKNVTKRKVDDICDDPNPSKILRKSKPLEASDGANTKRIRPGTSRKLAKPRRRGQISAKSKPRSGLSEKSNTKSSISEVKVDDDISRQSNPESDQSDDEYLLSNNFFVNMKRSQCRCQETQQKFPNGRDSSWERAAPLNHGSLIQFGCVQFVFSIVNYPAPRGNRPYSAAVPKPPPIPSREPEESPATDKNDLTFKLMSILNVLSSKSPDNRSHPELASDHSSASSLVSRSNSPAPELQNGHVSDRSESPITAGHIDGQIEITG